MMTKDEVEQIIAYLGSQKGHRALGIAWIDGSLQVIGHDADAPLGVSV